MLPAEVRPPVDPRSDFIELDHEDRDRAKQCAEANNAEYCKTLCEGVVRTAVAEYTKKGWLFFFSVGDAERTSTHKMT